MKYQEMKKGADSSCLWFDIKKAEKLKQELVYLDNAATTYQKPEQVYKAMDMANQYLSVNAGRGSYELARLAVEGMDKLREKILELVNGKTYGQVVLTPSATIAFNQIIGGLGFSEHDRVYVSPFEHNAVMRTLSFQQKKCGFTIEELPLDVDKLEIDLEKTEYLFRENPPTHVFLSQVSNVTGYILPVSEIYKMTKEITNDEGIIVVDGAQSVGLIQWEYDKLPVDFLVFAGHKTLYGPFGIAGFIKNKQAKLNTYLTGGTGSASLTMNMPEDITGFEPGSPNISAIAGLYAAIEFIQNKKVSSVFDWEKQRMNELIQGLSTVDGVQMYLPKNLDAHIGILSFTAEGYRSEDLGTILDEDYKIAVRTGYHCAPLIHTHIKDMEYGGTVRVSVSCFTTKEQVERFVDAVRECLEG